MAFCLKSSKIRILCKKLQNLSIALYKKEHTLVNSYTICQSSIVTSRALLSIKNDTVGVNRQQCVLFGGKNILDSESNTVNYKCPTLYNTISILEIFYRDAVDFEMPTLPKLKEISMPESSSQIISPVKSPIGAVSEMEAGSVMKKRKKKMKKHQRDKWKKKFVVMIRKMRERKEKRKQEALRQRISDYHRWAEEFDPLQYITSEIEKAKKGGYRIQQKKIFSD